MAQEFAKALKQNYARRDGFLESDLSVVTWCVGHLVTMSYPESYDPALKRWSLETLPFLPAQFKYEIIPGVAKQFKIVSGLLNRPDIDTIYVCTDSGREGEYIYRLVARMAGVKGKNEKRVWIDSQTEEEILRGIREAKDESEYDNLSESAYLRAKEDYLMGINFSRVLSLKYGNAIASYNQSKYQAVSVGRVMTCVLGMVVRREREIRNFVKTPFYRVIGSFGSENLNYDGEWRAVKGSRYFESPLLYKENGFQKYEDAKQFADDLLTPLNKDAVIESIERKTEKKNPPLLYNLAELQNDCSRFFKISPDQTLKIVQELYEKKCVTYPRTDARVLSSAVAKEINRNLNGLTRNPLVGDIAREVLDGEAWKTIGRTRYTNDKQITDHYAIIPTGAGNPNSLGDMQAKVYEVICRRFLAVFYPPAVYQKASITTSYDGERFFAGFKVLTEEGYLKVMKYSFFKKRSDEADSPDSGKNEGETTCDLSFLKALSALKKGSIVTAKDFQVKEGETSPPKRYTSGSMILAMENAGQLIEDEELRAQIKGSGIGTSATRAEILNKLVKITYLNLNKKTQVITPTQLGEQVYDVVYDSIRSLLNPDLTASWEKGLTYVAEGSISGQEYMNKLEAFVRKHTQNVKQLNNQNVLRAQFDAAAPYYKNTPVKTAGRKTGTGRTAAGRSTAQGAAAGRSRTAKATAGGTAGKASSGRTVSGRSAAGKTITGNTIAGEKR